MYMRAYRSVLVTQATSLAANLASVAKLIVYERGCVQSTVCLYRQAKRSYTYALCLELWRD